ncbi:hypothetical protein [Mesorhizobium sp. Z1-4]|uniref:hypothetical protein n=1 Tax=Mesorhizobium sp. Z1-4 TaxID=2448478 RepID=UPI001FE18C8E|nr:hypothetical protein [Mesorhizobium sp. Z1-4]
MQVQRGAPIPARIFITALVAGVGLLAASPAAFAHTADRGFVMLLPTGYYLFGGAAAVALSFAVLVVMPPVALAVLFATRLRLVARPIDGRLFTSTISFLVVASIWYAGLFGSRDPLSNPLPLVFWTVFWVGFTLVVGLRGNLWRWLEPWYGPSRLILKAIGRADAPPPLKLPERMGHAGALVLLLGFGWFELVYPSPDDPALLAKVLIAYWLFNLAGILAFGHEAWTARIELFSVLYSMIGRLAPFQREADSDGRQALFLRFPGGALEKAPPLPRGATLFLLLALATVSFDGLMRTFFWLSLVGVNPLEFPGRSAVVFANTVGLAGIFSALSALFVFAVWLGNRIAGSTASLATSCGLLVWSILPIALAYHFSHYLGVLVINGQYALAAISDPLSNGWNIFGTAGFHVAAAATAGYDAAWIIWNLQSAAIIGGHLIAVMIAHALAFRIYGSARQAALSQIPLAILMVGYTVFGLWLLSSPTGG